MDYTVPPRARRCAKTGREFQPGESFYSVLDRTPDGGLVRLDYADAVWFGPPPDAFAFWRSRVPATGPAIDRPIDPDAAINLFERIVTSGRRIDPALVAALALWLVRKKRLKLIESKTVAGRTYWMVRVMPGGSIYPVEPLDVDEDRMARLEDELRSLLDCGVE